MFLVVNTMYTEYILQYNVIIILIKENSSAQAPVSTGSTIAKTFKLRQQF